MKRPKLNDQFNALTIIGKITKNNFLCQCKCGNIVEASTQELLKEKVVSCGCLGKSKGEYKVNCLLLEARIPYEQEKTFPKCNLPGYNKRVKAKFDFYVDNTYLIEYDGYQHFCTGTKNLDKLRENDEYKNQWCRENNIPLIRIPYYHLEDLDIEDLLLETSKFIIN